MGVGGRGGVGLMLLAILLWFLSWKFELAGEGGIAGWDVEGWERCGGLGEGCDCEGLFYCCGRRMAWERLCGLSCVGAAVDIGFSLV